NVRLRAARPTTVAQREKLTQERDQVQRRLEGLRQFVEQGDTSTKVRAWLAEGEAEEQRLGRQLAHLGAPEHQPIQVQPGRVGRYLRDLHETLRKAGARARQLLREDLDRIVIHPVRLDTSKPFARAEVVTTGKGLLDRVTFVVAGAGFEPAT